MAPPARQSPTWIVSVGVDGKVVCIGDVGRGADRTEIDREASVDCEASADTGPLVTSLLTDGALGQSQVTRPEISVNIATTKPASNRRLRRRL